MRRVRRNPKYTAWIPVKLNYFENDIDLDPFRPYFGESSSQMEKAEEAYCKMLEDASEPHSAELRSDGEFDQNGALVTPQSDTFDSLSARRLRQSQRQIIVHTIRERGNNQLVLKQLAAAFRIADTRRILHAYKVALLREKKAQQLISKRRSRREKEHAIFHALDFPSCEPLSQRAHIDFVDKFFCFKCFLFGCEMHTGEDVLPTRPIPDDTVSDRMGDLIRRVAKPCSARCFLLEEHLQARQSAEEGHPWSDEEVMLLRQACSLTDEDPCSLSIIIGSKSCREVRARISSAQEQNLIAQAVRAAKQERKKTCNKKGKKKKKAEPSNSPIQRIRRWQESKSPDGKSHVHDVEEDDDENAADEDNNHAVYKPCNHTGACTKSNGCTCVKYDLHCESTCCCNTGRFSQIGDVIRWVPQSEGCQGSKKTIKCKNRHWGCSCRSGHCNTNSCECFKSNRVCNPDFCHHCEADILPQYVSVYERRCRNTELITARHKRTVAGKSNVHGFGLFALDHFNDGDLIGHYCGRTVDPEKVDFMLRASDAKKLTYAFNLTARMTIDGACFGSKVRLINHSSNAAAVNCNARLERVRGEARIALKAIKPVKPGDEFLFDYNITQGNEWLDQDSDEGSVFESDPDDSPGKQSRDSALKPDVDIIQPMQAPSFVTNKKPARRKEDEVEFVGFVPRNVPVPRRTAQNDVRFARLIAGDLDDDEMGSDSTMDCPVFPYEGD
ncbi:SET domain containing protein [Gracilaria domingensis]|nr:SET domain containing protein [Gracilaria domingensis]